MKKIINSKIFNIIHYSIPIMCLIIVLLTENLFSELIFGFYGLIFAWQRGWGMGIREKAKKD